MNCPRCNTGAMIGVQIPDVYDGVLYWLCSGCGMPMHRFASGPMRTKAQPFIDDIHRNYEEMRRPAPPSVPLPPHFRDIQLAHEMLMRRKN